MKVLCLVGLVSRLNGDRAVPYFLIPDAEQLVSCFKRPDTRGDLLLRPRMTGSMQGGLCAFGECWSLLQPGTPRGIRDLSLSLARKGLCQFQVMAHQIEE